MLGNERTVWVRAPRRPGAPAALAVFLDAEQYRERVGAEDLLAAWEAANPAGNCTAVFVSVESEAARSRECPCHPPFARFLHEEFAPWLERVVPPVERAGPRALIGLSYTGLAATYGVVCGGGRAAGGQVWDRVVAQSGSFWWGGGLLPSEVAAGRLRAPAGTEFYLEVGSRETASLVRHREDLVQEMSQIEGVRRMASALRETGATVEYREVEGGHDFATWRASLPAALAWALRPG